jgi:hypothetical protein
VSGQQETTARNPGEYVEDIMKEGMTRRQFLGASAVGALGMAAGGGVKVLALPPFLEPTFRKGK